MKFKCIAIFLFIFNVFVLAQANKNTFSFEKYLNAPEEIKNRKAFLREFYFYEQRCFPDNTLPDDAYSKSLEQRNNLRKSNTKNFNITWSSIGPTPGTYPGYGNITSRIITGAYHPTNPNIIFVGAANGGIWKSTNAGSTWIPLSDNEVSLSSGALVIDKTDPNIMYYGTGEATFSGSSYYGMGLLKSTDGGSTWTNYRTGLPTYSYFSRLIISPKNSSTLFAALGSAGLYKSTNGGVNWGNVMYGTVNEVVSNPIGDTIFAATTSDGLWRSTDGGVNFNLFGTGFPTGSRIHFDLCQNVSRVMYASKYNSSVVTAYKSTDFGATWSQISTSTDFLGSQAWYDFYCKVDPKNPNEAYIGTIDVFRTTDGTNFSNITNGYGGGTVHVDQHYVVFHPTDQNTCLFLNDGGIWRSTNNGNSFENLNTNLTLTQFYRVKINPTSITHILGGTQDNGTQQTRGTLNWSAAFGGDGGEVAFNLSNSNYLLGETQNGGLRRSSDNGYNWYSASSGISTNEGVAWVAPIQPHPVTNGTFYTARQKLYVSSNNGSSWTALSGDINGTTAVRELAISKSNQSIIYATSSRYVFRSSNGGANFTSVSTGLPNKTATSVYVHPNQSNIAFVTFSGFGTPKVYKTTNDGISWTNISSNLPDSPVNDILIYPDEPDNTYFVATDIGVYLTQNGGTSWTELYEGLPNTVIVHLDYHQSSKYLVAATHGRGMYKAYIDFSQVTSNFSTIADWNLMSMPILTSNMSKINLFPSASSAAYSYSNGYVVQDTLTNGVGYWLKFPIIQSHSFQGQSVSPKNINLIAGWNLIGNFNSTINTSQITTNPPNIIISSFFEYNNGYISSTSLVPGKGYWVKTNANGVMTIP